MKPLYSKLFSELHTIAKADQVRQPILDICIYAFQTCSIILLMRGSIQTKITFDNSYVFCAYCIYIHYIFKAYLLKLDTCNVLYRK